MRYVAFVAFAFALAATPALAGSKAKVEVVDASTLRVSAAPKPGVKFAAMRETLLRTACEETLRRGYEWFDLSDVVDLTRERTVDLRPPEVAGSMLVPASSGGLRLITGTAVGPNFGGQEVRLIEPGAAATIRMGKGARPEGASVVDARELLASLL